MLRYNSHYTMKFTQWYIFSILTKGYNHHRCLILEYFHHLSSNTNKISLVGWSHWLNGPELEKLREIVKEREAWQHAVNRVTKIWTRLNDSTTTYRYTTRCLSICLSVGWYRFHFWAFMNNAAMNICVQVLLWIYCIFSVPWGV